MKIIILIILIVLLYILIINTINDSCYNKKESFYGLLGAKCNSIDQSGCPK